MPEKQVAHMLHINNTADAECVILAAHLLPSNLRRGRSCLLGICRLTFMPSLVEAHLKPQPCAYLSTVCTEAVSALKEQ